MDAATGSESSEGRERYVDLVRWLASWAWPIDEAEAKRLPTSRGWVLVDEEPGQGGIFDTGLVTERSWASFRVTDDELRDVSIQTAFFGQQSDDEAQALADTFAVQVEAVTEVLGEPRLRKPGVDGSALWDLSNGAMLDVGRTDRSCSWMFTSPAYAEVQRDLGR